MVHEDGRVVSIDLKNKEEKKSKIHKALLATGIDPKEIPTLTIELLAENVPVTPFKGLKAQEASAVNLTASAMAGAVL